MGTYWQALARLVVFAEPGLIANMTGRLICDSEFDGRAIPQPRAA